MRCVYDVILSVVKYVLVSDYIIYAINQTVVKVRLGLNDSWGEWIFMLDRTDLDKPASELEQLIESLEQIQFDHLVGVVPSKADEALKIEKALSRVVRALHKARGDLATVMDMCEQS